MPEWDDHVDAGYDFIHDEHSFLNKQKREMVYIWNIFDKSTTPIDGVLISREQVEDTPTKFDRLTTYGVYEDPELSVPDWMPTISDCGAWGYKSLPFPPYENKGMLDFYETLDVSVGVTVDHLVLGSGHSARLYLNERSLPDDFGVKDIPDSLGKAVDDVMVDEWPTEWPGYVSEHEPEICNGDTGILDPDIFEGEPEEVIERLESDPRAVYRKDDMKFRYDLTLRNAEEMWELYQEDDYSFRLMVAVQGWNPDSYVKAVNSVLDMGYQYLGIGGVAGSHEESVKDIVSSVGSTLKNYQAENKTRVDVHVFGFAKTGAFEEIGKNGVTSFDSASMLRSAWTGGSNYHLDSDTKYDALRVRYGSHTDTLSESIEKALRGQEVLRALRAFDEDRSISEALREWYASAVESLEGLPDYLQSSRHEERYDTPRLGDVEKEFREDYEHSYELKANFGEKFQSSLSRPLRDDSEDKPTPWHDYLDLITEAKEKLDDRVPTHLDEIEKLEKEDDEVGAFDHVWLLIESYAEYIGDEGLLEGYSELLRDEPWNECGCRICEEHGIEIAIFRGNNRNRRRGFHNTRRFYDEFEEVLPKMLVLIVPNSNLSEYETVEKYLDAEHTKFWDEVYDLPVAEVGVVTSEGVYEWWEKAPDEFSTGRAGIEDVISEKADRYPDIFIGETDRLTKEMESELRDMENTEIKPSEELSEEVREKLSLSFQSALSRY